MVYKYFLILEIEEMLIRLLMEDGLLVKKLK
jgi:hypothetical protein